MVSTQFSSVQLLSHVQLFVTPWTKAHQAFLFITNSRSSLKLTSIESVMPSNRLILCHPLLLPPSVLTSIRVFSDAVSLRGQRGRFSWIIWVGRTPSRGSLQQGDRRDSQRKDAMLKRGRREGERPEDTAPLALQTEEGPGTKECGWCSNSWKR